MYLVPFSLFFVLVILFLFCSILFVSEKKFSKNGVHESYFLCTYLHEDIVAMHVGAFGLFVCEFFGEIKGVLMFWNIFGHVKMHSCMGCCQKGEFCGLINLISKGKVYGLVKASILQIYGTLLHGILIDIIKVYFRMNFSLI